MGAWKLGRPLAVFGFLGGGAGILTALLVPYELGIMTVGAGVPLALALGIASTLERKCTPEHISSLRLLVALGVVATAYPVSVVVMMMTLIIFRPVLLDANIHFLLRFLLGTVAGASLMPIALLVVKKRWNNFVWSLFLATGLITALVAFGGHSIFSASETVTFDPVFAFLLFPIGDALFSTVFGYGLVRESGVQTV